MLIKDEVVTATITFKAVLKSGHEDHLFAERLIGLISTDDSVAALIIFGVTTVLSRIFGKITGYE
jgi:hypothetical protein